MSDKGKWGKNERRDESEGQKISAFKIEERIAAFLNQKTLEV